MGKVNTDVAETARRLGRTEGAVRRAAREGRFGSAAQRDAKGHWRFTWPNAGSEFASRTDPTRYAAARFDEQLPKLAPTVVYESSRGRLEVSHADFASLCAACESPDASLLTPHLVTLLDRIMAIVGAAKTETMPATNTTSQGSAPSALKR